MGTVTESGYEHNLREWWVSALERVMRPPLDALAKGEGEYVRTLPHHPGADSGRMNSIELELAGRVLNSLAPWLGNEDSGNKDARLREEFADMAREAIRIGCDPERDTWWGFDTHQQSLVDAAFLATAFLRSPQVLWEPLDEETKRRVVDCFTRLRDRKPHFNNWLLFGAAPEAFLAIIGEDWDRMRVDYAIRQHEQWYVGDGHYKDGPRFHCDYYNSFVIHPMLHEILSVVAQFDPQWEAFLDPQEKRLMRYAAIQERTISGDGTWPVTGRSICYRTGAFHALAYAAWKGLLAEGLPHAQVRCALTAAIRSGLLPEANFREDGWLTIGLHGSQPGLGERYITTASLYLAGFVFAPLGLPEEHLFWTGPDAPWTQVKAWELGQDLPADHAIDA